MLEQQRLNNKGMSEEVSPFTKHPLALTKPLPGPPASLSGMPSDKDI